MPLQKKFRPFILALLAVILLIVIAAHFLSGYAEKKAKAVLLENSVKVSSVEVNLLTRTIQLKDLEWTLKNDSLPQFPHHLTTKNIRLEGIAIYKLIADKDIHIKKIVFEDGDFQYNRNLKQKNQTTDKKKVDLNSITIDRIVLKNFAAVISRDSAERFKGTVNLSLEDVSLDDVQKAKDIASYQVGSTTLLLNNLSFDGKQEMYSTSVSRIYVNSIDEKIEIDSIIIVPKYSKYQFTRRLGRQVSRMSVLIPKISVSGISFDQFKDSVFHTSMIEINAARLHVFRDKRLPFIKKTNMPLPIAMIMGLKVGLNIDSLKLIDAKVTYEEFPEKGYHSGQIVFDKLNATLDHLSNRNLYAGYKQATLRASSYLMGKGFINAEFSLPYGSEQVYNAKGSLKNFSLHRLNPMLENVAFMSITSGKLNQLAFNFDYTDSKSTGTVLINYEDLKMNSLTKEKESEKHEFKSFLVNTFLKKDKTGEVDKEKRMGTIEFERDKRRAIFHYWWNSVLTGLKSTAIDSNRKKEKAKEKRNEGK